ncbi:c-type cytochrome [uncultured Endozoicomonas sp.]|uniref:c-type cytochrome n=1 Tax=uncultured Endozoicomonas sp. TaxID=432652 RepID=UPI0026254F6D|nr:c-type cytochrome [uncultured Endozoicomonas sp.]
MCLQRALKYQASILLLFVMLTGCDPTEQTTFDPALSSQIQPHDPQLSAIYDRSCKTCHTLEGTGAPLTGDSQGWQVRMDKGMDALLDSVINGSGGMPPFGMCMDCDVDEFEALITFMAAPAIPATSAE